MVLAAFPEGRWHLWWGQGISGGVGGISGGAGGISGGAGGAGGIWWSRWHFEELASGGAGGICEVQEVLAASLLEPVAFARCRRCRASRRSWWHFRRCGQLRGAGIPGGAGGIPGGAGGIPGGAGGMPGGAGGIPGGAGGIPGGAGGIPGGAGGIPGGAGGIQVAVVVLFLLHHNKTSNSQ